MFSPTAHKGRCGRSGDAFPCHAGGGRYNAAYTKPQVALVRSGASFHPSFGSLVICTDPGSNQPPPAPPLSFSRLNPAGSELNTVGLQRSLTHVSGFSETPPTWTVNPFSVNWQLFLNYFFVIHGFKMVSLFLSKLFLLVA